MKYNNWKTVRLGDVCVLNYGKSLVATNRKAGVIPVYSSAGITGWHNEPLVKGEGIIVGRKGTVGSVYHSKEPFYCIDTAYYILPDKAYDFRYMYYRLKSLGLEEQERIAWILGALDDKIECNNRINRNLEEQAAALFRRWFVDFEFPDSDPTSPTYGKPYRSAGGTMQDSPLGKIPIGWKACLLEDIGTIIGGGTPSTTNKDYFIPNGISWITPKDLSLNKNKFISKGTTDITDLGYKNSSAKIIPKNSILFSSRAPIGYISITKNKLCTNQGFKSIIPNSEIHTPYIYLFLKNNIAVIESKASGSTFKEASGALMKSLGIPIANKKISIQFYDICNAIFKQQEKVEEENSILSTLRDTLLPKLMNNETYLCQ